MKVKIYQIKDKKSDCLFRDYDKKKFNFKDYSFVYEMDYETESSVEEYMKVLDDLFFMLNLGAPEDYCSRSLSVSDIVELDGRKFYCNSVGWEEI